MTVCRHWHRYLSDENNDTWRTHCLQKLSEEVVKSDLLSALPTYKSKLRAFYHSWNPNDCSRNVYIKPNGFTLHRNPVAQSTDGSRGKIGFREGRHAWEVMWEGPLGTVAVVGVATNTSSIQCSGYVALLGKCTFIFTRSPTMIQLQWNCLLANFDSITISFQLGADEQSWGWNLVDNNLLHNGDTQGTYPLLNNAPKYQVGERIRVILDCDDKTLSFEKNYEFLGIAFKGEWE